MREKKEVSHSFLPYFLQREILKVRAHIYEFSEKIRKSITKYF